MDTTETVIYVSILVAGVAILALVINALSEATAKQLEQCEFFVEARDENDNPEDAA
jgi:hypothetical protein